MLNYIIYPLVPEPTFHAQKIHFIAYCSLTNKSSAGLKCTNKKETRIHPDKECRIFQSYNKIWFWLEHQSGCTVHCTISRHDKTEQYSNNKQRSSTFYVEKYQICLLAHSFKKDIEYGLKLPPQLPSVRAASPIFLLLSGPDKPDRVKVT